MNTTHQGIITLLASAVTGRKLSLPEGFTLDAADEILRRQSLVSLAYQGSYHCGIAPESERMQHYRGIYLRNLLRSERQMRAATKIFQAFEERGIDYMPLKGCNMKKLYPQPELRVMGDADILIHPEQHGQIETVMKELGFTFRREDDHVFDWYSDALHVELHKSLVPPNDVDYYDYFSTGWQRAVRGQGSRHDLSAEDAFIFQFAHFARHYRMSGIGCRHVVDLYVYRQAFPGLDESYIETELSKLHLLKFYENVKRLLGVWFAGDQPDEITDLITAFIFSGGNWGSTEAATYAQQVKSAKKNGTMKHSGYRAIREALFPPRSSLSYRYTVLRKVPCLLPAIWLVRWIDVIFFRPQNIKNRVTILKKVNDDVILTHQQTMEKVGLEFHFE